MIALCAAYFVANLSWTLSPFQFPTFSTESGFGPVSAGWILSCDILSAALVSIGIGYMSRRRATRGVLCAAASLIILCAVVSVFLPSFRWILLCRIVSGAATGVLLAGVSSAVAQLDEPETRYGHMNGFMNLSGFLLVLVTPMVLGYLSFHRAIFAVIAVVALMSVPAIAIYPIKTSVYAAAGSGRGMSGLHGWLLCAAVFIFSIVGGSLYAVTEVVGEIMHVTGTALGVGIAVQATGAVIGSYIAGWLDRRLGSYGGALLAAAGITTAVALFAYGQGAVAFDVANLLFGASGYFGFTICLGLAAKVDASGSCAAAATGAFYLAGGVGPLIGGVELDWNRGGIGIFLWSTSIFMSAFFFLYWLIKRSASVSVDASIPVPSA